jgi:hypothetical protein
MVRSPAPCFSRYLVYRLFRKFHQSIGLSVPQPGLRKNALRCERTKLALRFAIPLNFSLRHELLASPTSTFHLGKFLATTRARIAYGIHSLDRENSHSAKSQAQERWSDGLDMRTGWTSRQSEDRRIRASEDGHRSNLKHSPP